jgi:ACS family tartrate transporter-like MFS transporter
MRDAAQQALLAKVTRRLIPLLFVLYAVNILDRVSIGFARLQMMEDLGLREDQYALGAGVFYVGYLLFEVPSNLILHRTGARRWISRILVSWGLVTCAMMAIRGPWGLYLLRVLLGFAEAGFFPGMILYLSYWFPARERARAVAWFMAASPLAGIVGSPLSGAILEYMDQVGGLRGWQWLFLLEGAPAVALGILVLQTLPDRPSQAGWLTAEERERLAALLLPEAKAETKRQLSTLLQAAADPRVWLLTLLYFTVAAGSNGVGFYLPKLMQTRFPELDKFQLGLLVAVPHLCALGCMVLNGTHSDRTGERRWHVAGPAFVSAVGWAASAHLDSPVAALCGLVLVQVGIMSMLPTFWSLPTSFLRGVAAAGGIALVNSVGNLGGFVGPIVIGQLKEATGSFTGGLLAMAATMAAGGVLALCVRPEPAEPVGFP